MYYYVTLYGWAFTKEEKADRGELFWRVQFNSMIFVPEHLNGILHAKNHIRL